MTNITITPEVNPFIINERWLPVLNYEHKYLISDKGRVFSFHSKTIMYLDTKNKYKFLRVTINKKRKTIPIHRLVAQAFIPNPENKPQVNHINSNPSDNTLENLEWCTPKENIQHSVRTGSFFTEKRKKYSDSRKGIGIGIPFGIGKPTLVGAENHKSIPLFMFDSDKNLIQEFESQNLCAIFLKVKHKFIHRAMKAGKKYKGFYFSKNRIF